MDSHPVGRKGFLHLEHELLKTLKAQRLPGREFLLAVSGGCDSMALFRLFVQVAKAGRLRFRVAHVHHGASRSKQGRFRDRAWRFVHLHCAQNGVEFVSNLTVPGKPLAPAPARVLKSEAELREFRYSCLRQWLRPGEILVTAHNADDVLETRLIRLIRGTGRQGLTALRHFDGTLLRPLLDHGRRDLKTYNQQRGQKWVVDPSNRELGPFRNWLRHVWLPMLERRRPGSLKSLARSLKDLSEPAPPDWGQVITQKGILYGPFLELSPEQQRQVLAAYMRDLGLKNYTLKHINEVLKRLSSERKKERFSLLKHQWSVDTQVIRADPN